MIFLSQNGITSVASDVTVVLFLVLMTIGTMLAVIYFLCKYSQDGSPVRKKKSVIAIIIAVGAAVRIIFAMCIRGYREDYDLFADMFKHLGAEGLDGYYTGKPDAVLYPLVYVVYLLFGGISYVTGLSDFALGAQFMIKLPLIAADILIAYGVYKIARKYFNERTALVLFAFVCACPAFFIASAVWTSPIVFTALFAVWGCYFLARKKYGLTIGFFTAAAFASKEGIFLFPVAAVFSGYHFVKAAINVNKDKPSGKAVADGRYSAIYEVPCAFIGSLVVAYLLGLLMTYSYSYDPFKYIYEFTVSPLVNWDFFTFNGLSVYSLFNQNGQEAGARFPSWVFACVFAAIISAVVCIVYFSKRNRATMVMLAAYSLFTLSVYYPGMNAAVMILSLAALGCAYALVKDKRLLHVLFLTCITYVVNSSSVLANAGYLNNLADYVFSDPSYTGSILMSGGVNAVCITCSALVVLAHLYFTVVTVSVGMTGQKKMLNACNGFGASLREFFTVRRG